MCHSEPVSVSFRLCDHVSVYSSYLPFITLLFFSSIFLTLFHFGLEITGHISFPLHTRIGLSECCYGKSYWIVSVFIPFWRLRFWVISFSFGSHSGTDSDLGLDRSSTMDWFVRRGNLINGQWKVTFVFSITWALGIYILHWIMNPCF